MDNNLTQYLAQSEGPLPYHIEVDICHDISKALNYLHSNDIIHCNLSSRNILLSSGKAKVDISTSFILRNEPECPGRPNYMPPEAFGMQYTCKLDCFSFGVLALEIITRESPDPGPRSLSEIERRRSHIDLIDPEHPLRPIVLECLKDRDTVRPSSEELCHRLAALKKGPEYVKSVQRDAPAVTQRQLSKANTEQRLELARSRQELQESRQELQEGKQELQESKQELAQAYKEKARLFFLYMQYLTCLRHSLHYSSCTMLVSWASLTPFHSTDCISLAGFEDLEPLYMTC